MQKSSHFSPPVTSLSQVTFFLPALPTGPTQAQGAQPVVQEELGELGTPQRKLTQVGLNNRTCLKTACILGSILAYEVHSEWGLIQSPEKGMGVISLIGLGISVEFVNHNASGGNPAVLETSEGQVNKNSWLKWCLWVCTQDSSHTEKAFNL